MGKPPVDPQATFDFSVSLPAPAKEAITEAMQRVDDCASEDWKTVFDECVVDAARKKSEITSDDVLAEWEAIPNRPSTHNLAAIGPAMKRAAREGILTSTNRVERSARAVKHGIRHTIWASNIYRPEANKDVARQEEAETIVEQAVIVVRKQRSRNESTPPHTCGDSSRACRCGIVSCTESQAG